MMSGLREHKAADRPTDRQTDRQRDETDKTNSEISKKISVPKSKSNEINQKDFDNRTTSQSLV